MGFYFSTWGERGKGEGNRLTAVSYQSTAMSEERMWREKKKTYHRVSGEAAE